MAQFAFRDQLLLAKIQADPDIEEALDPATDAIRVSNLQFSPQFETDSGENEHQSGLDQGDPQITSGGANMSFDVRMSGAGAEGAEPEYSVFMEMSGFAKTVTGAEITNTAQAGGANTATLAVAESAVDDAYKGMPLFLTGGTGSGQSAVILSYDGTTKVATVAKNWTTPPDATTTYRIPPNVLYRYASSNLKNASLAGFQNSISVGAQSIRRRLFKAVGSMSLNIGTSQVPQFSFNTRGAIPARPDDVARPTGVAFDTSKAQAFRNAEALYAGIPIGFSAFSLSDNSNLDQEQDPAQEFGFGNAAITQRAVGGQFSPYMRNKASQDWLGRFFDSTEGSMVLRWGPSAGNRISILMPRVLPSGNPSESAIGSFAGESVPFRVLGADDGLWYCVH